MSNIIPLPPELNISAIGQSPEATMKAVVASCDEHDFAIVRDYITPEQATIEAEEARAHIARMKQAYPDSWNRAQPGEGPHARIPILHNKRSYPHINATTWDMRTTLSEAAAEHGTRRMNIGTAVGYTVMNINEYGPGEHMIPHCDGNKGIVASLGLAGLRLLTLDAGDGTPQNVTILGPGDLVVLPGQVGPYGFWNGRQKRHGVHNATPDNGTSLALVAVYNSSSNRVIQPEVAGPTKPKSRRQKQ